MDPINMRNNPFNIVFIIFNKLKKIFSYRTFLSERSSVIMTPSCLPLIFKICEA